MTKEPVFVVEIPTVAASIATRPILTIAIPTYNRAKSLRRSLGAIIQQIDAIESGWSEIEVIVSDNCSTDETAAVVCELAAGRAIGYSKHPTNLGMEGNFLSCFERARGSLVWTFSDDDVLVDGALAEVMALLSGSLVDIVYLKPKFLRGELETFPTTRVDFGFEKVTAEYFALRSNGLLSFLSAVIVNKDRYLQLQPDPNTRRYVGTWLAHYEWIYTLIAAGAYFYVASRSVIRARTGVTGGYDIFQVFGEHYTAIGREKFGGKPRLRRDFESAMLYMHIPGFIIACRGNRFGRFEYSPERISKQIISTYGDSLFFRAVIHTQLFAGPRIAALAYRMSQIYARLWMIGRRLMVRKIPR